MGWGGGEEEGLLDAGEPRKWPSQREQCAKELGFVQIVEIVQSLHEGDVIHGDKASMW